MDKEIPGGVVLIFWKCEEKSRYWKWVVMLVHHSLLSKTMEQVWKKEQKDKYHGYMNLP